MTVSGLDFRNLLDLKPLTASKRFVFLRETQKEVLDPIPRLKLDKLLQ